ncbi:unnamed protein product [Bursaphelenchus xylophilus]|uniref:(pine wood nematode) hypothetical protein n=1 Tax=Bursaphelenchus xylophilus TaxID=6326 RepID=A0A1I7S0Z3_BURXY|nr:unnamed protein product [Bursaphelenchus xylophilus]CAG9087915.1 unnamed protein product [Bursaphelenchus xylophilus]
MKATVIKLLVFLSLTSQIGGQTLTNQPVQSKYFEMRLEDFHDTSPQSMGVYPTLSELSLDALLDDEKSPPDVYYRQVFSNMKKVAPNLKTLSIYGGYKFRPEYPKSYMISNEIQHIQRSLRTIVGEAHHAGINFGDINMQAVLYFPERMVQESNYLSLIKKHFHVVRTIGPRVQCKFMIENTPVELWITMEDEMFWRTTGIDRTPFHGRGKRQFGVQKKHEALYHLEDFFYEKVVKERKATRFILFSPINMFGSAPQGPYAIAAKNLKTLSPNADHVQMYGGGHAALKSSSEFPGELNLLRDNLYAAVQAVQQAGMSVDNVMLKVYYTGVSIPNANAVISQVFKVTPSPHGPTAQFLAFSIGQTPVRMEIGFTLPAEYAAQIDPKSHRSVFEVMPMHLQFDSLFEKIYKKRTLYQNGCRAKGLPKQGVFDPCGVKIIAPQQTIESFAIINPATTEKQTQLLHLTLGSNPPFHLRNMSQIYHQAFRNLKAIAPNLRDLSIDAKITIDSQASEKVGIIKAAVKEMVNAAIEANINLAREYVNLNLDFVGSFPSPSAWERHMGVPDIPLNPPYKLEYYEDDVLVRIETNYSAGISRRRFSKLRRRANRRRLRIKI